MIKDLEESGFFFMGGWMQRAKEFDVLKAILLCVYWFFSTILTPFDVYFSIICYNRKVDGEEELFYHGQIICR